MRHACLQNASRLVVKLGTGVLTDARMHPDLDQLRQLVGQVAAQAHQGKEVVLVTSGAVGAGMGALGFAKRPSSLAELQACAAIGQSRLMTTYSRLFAEHEIEVAQVLLTHEDLQHHERHLNARNTLITLLSRSVIPIINENDAVSFTELKFGDNDKLSALVACLLPADLLVVLTTVDGVVENFGTPQAHTIPMIERVSDSILSLAKGTTSVTAVGGMTTKIQAARITVRSGIPMVIASGRKKTVLRRILDGLDEGTIFIPQPSKLKGRKRWIAFFHHPAGTLTVDDGARQALRELGKSLLPPGILQCDGDFDSGEVVRIVDQNGLEFARGIARFSAAQIRRKEANRSEVIHRNNLVLL